jgi:hypothetical protein
MAMLIFDMLSVEKHIRHVYFIDTNINQAPVCMHMTCDT